MISFGYAMKITSKFELLRDAPRIIVERKGHYSSLASLPPPSFNDPSRLLAFPRRDRKAIHLTEYSADLLQRCFALSVLPSFLSVLLPVRPSLRRILTPRPFVCRIFPPLALQLRESDVYLSATTRIIVGGEQERCR